MFGRDECGANRDGAASAFTEPTTWPERLTRRWKVDVGEGYATPLVVRNTVYVFTRRNGSEVMTALDAATGQDRWHTSYPAPYAPATLAAPSAWVQRPPRSSTTAGCSRAG